ncbi:MAG: hypothetical protein V1841_01360 [Patescibacteria group bacterium]
MLSAKNFFIGLIVLAVLGISFYFTLGKKIKNSIASSRKDELASCLTGKGIKMYGLSTCSHCLEQKEAFGSSFSKINYIECQEGERTAKRCVDAQIQSVPAWTFPKDTAIDKQITSCEDCMRRDSSIYCKEPCYTVSVETEEFRVSGFLELEKLSQISNCSF